jgi:arginine decarboxylase
MSDWSVQHSRQTYNIAQWSDGYFDICERGHLQAHPNRSREHVGIDLVELAQKIKQEGLTFPVLVRFPDILQNRIQTLQAAFARAIQEHEYRGNYTAVYPIKVNQQRRVVEAILYRGELHVGLEAGSKPELLAVLAFSTQSNAVIVCNGYKDREYIRLALIAQRIGRRVFIILEKLSELDLVLEEAQKLNIGPCIGMRVRLATMGSGQWRNTGGEKSKFGFSAAQVLQTVEKLRSLNKLHLLQALHFHLGSQISNIADVQRGMRECARYYAALRSMGAPIDTIDVGGGLAVDYEGTRSRSSCSMNYSMQEYANNIVYVLSETCKEYELPHPHIITESGRAIAAHHALLITNVIAIEEACSISDVKQPANETISVLKDLWESYRTLTERTALEAYHDACYWLTEIHTMFTHGVVDLNERAQAEQIYYAICFKVRDYLKPAARAHREVIDELNEKLADKVFCNFSLFQSLPDSWAINQVFPILPLSGLDQKPSRRGILQDITCDSDGRVDTYVSEHGLDSTLPLVPFNADQPYLLGIFLVGAYQEILGDLHNLFGDTDSIQVELTGDGAYRLVHSMQGDTVESVLRYVNFNSEELLLSYRQQLARSDLTTAERDMFLSDLATGLKGYTYFED